MKKIYNIPEFAKYAGIDGLKNENLHIARYDEQRRLLYKSGRVTIDFYFLAIKNLNEQKTNNSLEQGMNSSSSLFLDCPHNILEWDISPPVSGYGILVSAKHLTKYAKDYNFMHYNQHEALWLAEDEAMLLWDLFGKAHHEFNKERFSTEVVVSYIALILSYTQVFYNRQFDARSKIYHAVIEDFYKNLEDYFNDAKGVAGLPSVAYFAHKANLSPNYFGDLVKHFTGESPIEHIHDFIIRTAKQKLKQTSLSISEISYSLGFDYPTYFTRFFRTKTGVAPKVFRHQ